MPPDVSPSRKLVSRLFEEQDLEQLPALYRSVWNAETTNYDWPPMPEEYFRWKLFDCPGRRLSLSIFDSGKLVGFCGVQNLKNAFRKGEEPCVQLTDMMIEPKYRKLVAWKMIARHLWDFLFPEFMIYGYTNKSSYRGVTALFNKYLILKAGLPIYSSVLNAGTFLKVKRAINLPGLNFSSMVHKLALKVRPNGEYEINEVSAPTKEYDLFWKNASADLEWGLVKDRQYLDWRFKQCPVESYKIIEARKGGELHGYMVTCLKQEPHYRRGFIADWLVPSGEPGALKALLKHTLRSFIARKADITTLWVSARHEEIAGLLKSFFFFKRAPEKILINAYKPDRHDKILTDFKNYFVNMGDSDHI